MGGANRVDSTPLFGYIFLLGWDTPAELLFDNRSRDGWTHGSPSSWIQGEKVVEKP